MFYEILLLNQELLIIANNIPRYFPSQVQQSGCIFAQSGIPHMEDGILEDDEK